MLWILGKRAHCCPLLFLFLFLFFFSFFLFQFLLDLIDFEIIISSINCRPSFQNVPMVSYHVITKCASTKTSSAITTSIVTMGATNAIAVRVFKPFRTCSRWCFFNVPDLSGTLYLFFFFLQSILKFIEKLSLLN